MSSKAPATKARPSYSSVAQSTVSAAAPAAPATVAAPSPASAPAVAPITGAQQISQYLQCTSDLCFDISSNAILYSIIKP